MKGILEQLFGHETGFHSQGCPTLTNKLYQSTGMFNPELSWKLYGYNHEINQRPCSIDWKNV